MADEMSVTLGQMIDAKYRIVRLLGTGGMGSVYEGENVRIGRRVAIKVLNAHVAALTELTERFQREARVAAKVGSPHICDVLDLGDLPNGDHYLVMELLEGESLEERLSAGLVPAADLVVMAMELLDGLGTMHQAGVIHRDLKPANVFLSRTTTGRGEMVKILDFGVAKLEGFGPGGQSMTRTGAMIGTPLYMSPEQAKGARDVDARTDLYAASVIFYRALSGQLPHVSENLNELLFKVVLEDARPLRELAPDVDEGLARIIHTGLAREVDDRFPTARAYQDALVAWSRGQTKAKFDLKATLPTHPPPAMADLDLGGIALKAPSTGVGTPIAWVESSPASSRAPDTNAHVEPRPRNSASSAPPPALSASAATGIAATQASAASPVAATPPVVRVSISPPAQAKARASSAPPGPAEPTKSSRSPIVLASLALAAIGVVALARSGSAPEATSSAHASPGDLHAAPNLDAAAETDAGPR